MHRAIAVRGSRLQVYDEVTVTVTPYTGCGIVIGESALAERLEAAGFRPASAVLTCLFCASELPSDGDKMAVDGKRCTFAFLYGVDLATLAKRYPRVPPLSRAHMACSYADMEIAPGLRGVSRARMRPFSREFRRRLARKLLP